MRKIVLALMTLTSLVFFNCSTEDNDDDKTFTLTVEPSEGGNVIIEKKIVAAGEEVVLEAIPDEGYKFIEWSNGSTDNPLTLTINGDINIMAHFEVDGEISNPNTFEIAVLAFDHINYVLSGQDRNGVFISEKDPELTFKVGDIIKFSVVASGHPFLLKTTEETGTNDLIPNSQVTNNGASMGEIIWTPSETGTYYYQCQWHVGQGASITIN